MEWWAGGGKAGAGGPRPTTRGSARTAPHRRGARRARGLPTACGRAWRGRPPRGPYLALGNMLALAEDPWALAERLLEATREEFDDWLWRVGQEGSVTGELAWYPVK